MDLLLKTELVTGDQPVLRVDGEIDLLTADDLQTALEKAIATDPSVVIDMSGVTFFDAAGIRVVLQVARKLNGDGPLRITNAPRVAWILDVVGLGEVPAIDIRNDGE